MVLVRTQTKRARCGEFLIFVSLDWWEVWHFCWKETISCRAIVVIKVAHGSNFPQECWTIELNLILSLESHKFCSRVPEDMIFPWEGTYWYLQCMRRIKCHMTNVPISSPFFVSERKRNGESTQLVWKQIPFRLRDSPIMHSSVPDEFKPVIFAAGSGCEWVGCFSGCEWVGCFSVYWKIDEHWTAETQKWSFVCESVIHLFQGPHKLSHPLKFSKKICWSHVLHPATTWTFKTPKMLRK